MKINSFFCIAPWVSTCIDAESAVVPCAIFKKPSNQEKKDQIYEKLDEQDFLKGFNSKLMNETRKCFKSGVVPAGCHSCVEVQRANGYPYFKYMEDYHSGEDIFQNYDESTGEVSSVEKISFVDIAITNSCNLLCRMCNPVFCHQLKDEFTKIFDFEYPSDISFSSILPEVLSKSDNLSLLKIQGGEALLDPQFNGILENLIKNDTAKNIIIQINTNATAITTKILETFSNFKKVTILCSIDGWEQLNGYIRYPAKWNNIYSKLKLLQSFNREHPNVTFGVTTVIQLYNIFHVPKLVKNLFEEFNICAQLQLLYDPHHFNIRILSKEDKIKVEKNFQEILNNKNLIPLHHGVNSILTYMNSKNTSSDRDEFVRVTKMFDSERSQNILDVCPEYEQYFKTVL